MAVFLYAHPHLGTGMSSRPRLVFSQRGSLVEDPGADHELWTL